MPRYQPAQTEREEKRKPDMNPFDTYIENLLSDHLKKRRVAVWYDPRREFTSFVDGLPLADEGAHGLPKVRIGGEPTYLACFEGSFFGLKTAVEPLVAHEKPEFLLIYIPGVAWDRNGSVLIELEKGGESFEWHLKRLARFCLLERYTDGRIDKMLAPENITYHDVVGFLAQNVTEEPSVLKMIFGGVPNNAGLIATWLSDSGIDKKIQDKGAQQELNELIISRLGLELPEDAQLDDVRQKTLRYVLVGEFRDDLTCEAPASIAMIPEPGSKDQIKLVREVTQAMRDYHPEEYMSLSDSIAKELCLSGKTVDPGSLGNVDTFRFEEQALLSFAGELIRTGKYADAQILVKERRRSFWVDKSVQRQAQWATCGLMAELGIRILESRKTIKKPGKTPKDWVEAYCAKDGWYQVDHAQQSLESLVAKMDEEPENEIALEMVRQLYEDLLQEMATGFSDALSNNDWSLSGLELQTEVFFRFVESEKTPTAYFLVDAMRFSMATELVELLPNARDISINPVVGAWPSITPVGMAALLPGAESSFHVIEKIGKLAAKVEGSFLPDLSARLKYLKACVPGVVEMRLEKLLEMTTKRLGKTIADAPLLVVRSQEIDALGEAAGNLIARQHMDTMVSNVARAAKKLASVGMGRFVITADHGHLFTRKKEDAFKTDHPGGKTLEIHRRCWIGQGGSTPPGTVRLTGPQLGYDTNLEFVFPTGIGVFKAGGDLGYHHGGLSLQEMVVPVVSFRMGKEKAITGAEGEVQLSGVPQKITNRTFGVQLTLVGLFDVKPFKVRPILLSEGKVVGRSGMAVDAQFEQKTGCVTLSPKKQASVVMILDNEETIKVQIVIQDPATDRVLDQSDNIQVELGTR